VCLSTCIEITVIIAVNIIENITEKPIALLTLKLLFSINISGIEVYKIKYVTNPVITARISALKIIPEII
jgi:hypothetical protein